MRIDAMGQLVGSVLGTWFAVPVDVVKRIMDNIIIATVDTKSSC